MVRDTIARTMADRMGASLHQTVVVENFTGAGGSAGVGHLARAVPDGYTIGIVSGARTLPTAALTLPYDLLTDFEPVSMLPSEPNLILAKTSIPARNLQDLISWLKANAEKATGGPAASADRRCRRNPVSTANRSAFSAGAVSGRRPGDSSLVGGQIDTMITGPSISISLVRDGKIRAYGVTARSRISAAPDIPTTDEAGLPGFYIAVWHGLWVPKGTPKEIVTKLNAAVRDTLADPAVRQRLAALSLEMPSLDQQTPEGLYAQQKAEIEKWWPIMKGATSKANELFAKQQLTVAK